MSDRMLDKLAKILKQAENAGTPEEADAFLAKAQHLASTAAIDLAVARQHTAKRELREQPTHKMITIGTLRKRANAHFCEMFNYIALNNDVMLNIAHDNTWVVAFGMPSDIEVVETLYAALIFQMVEAGNAWIKTGAYKQEKVWRMVTKKDRWGGRWQEEEYTSITAQAARKHFYKGFTERVYYRLVNARRAAMESLKENIYTLPMDSGDPDAPYEVEVSAALVLKEKKDEVDEYYSRKSNARGSWRGAVAAVDENSWSRSAGDDAGRSARLSSTKAIGGQRTSVTAA
ncbi:DUF2786 domain-containing protein [Streptomyces sp. NPDC006631]|uniref:DUF2786 domain-containing protein n=1 Tax=Streptomyces sp. NPDC006631 TaxID=3364752 RepID=UPI0036A0583B